MIKKRKQARARDKGKGLNKYQKIAAIASILALLLSFAFASNRFVATGSLLDLLIRIRVENLAGREHVLVRFHYSLYKEGSQNAAHSDSESGTVFNEAREVNLVDVATPVPGTNAHTVALDHSFYIPGESRIGFYTFTADVYYRDERQAVTEFRVIVLPTVLHFFFTHTFMKILLIISLTFSAIGLWKRYRDRKRAASMRQPPGQDSNPRPTL